MIEDFSDALSGLPSIHPGKIPNPGLAPSTIKGGQAPGFVLTRFQRSGRQPSQALVKMTGVAAFDTICRIQWIPAE